MKYSGSPTTIVFVCLIFFLLVTVFSSGCDPVAKLAKSNNIPEKDSAAVAFYEKGKYEQASILLEELLGIYRGNSRREEIYYMYAYARYNMGEYVSASYYFEDWARQYPRQDKVEEMNFMGAYCYFLLSDPYYLDQKYTYKAIDQMQLFINSYPESEKREEANGIIMKLRERLAKKAFEQAKLYYKVSHFKAAVVAFQSLLLDFPDSDYREEGQYLLFRSSASLADESVQKKKQQRYLESMNYYQKFVDKFPDSKFAREAENNLGIVQKRYEQLLEDEKTEGKKKRKNILN